MSTYLTSTIIPKPLSSIFRMPAFLVTGVPGQQGLSTVHALLALGQTVHALVRNPDSAAAQTLAGLRGVTIFRGTYDDEASLRVATTGVAGVFLVPIPSLTDHDIEVQQTENVIAAAKATGVEQFVVSTSFTTERYDEWNATDAEYARTLGQWLYGPKSRVESAVKSAGFKYWTILRPAWLLYNYTAHAKVHFPELATKQELAHNFEPRVAIAHFDGGDIGKFAAKALVEPEVFGGQEIELGNENLDMKEVAAMMEQVTGVKVKTRKREKDEAKVMEGKIISQPWHELAGRHDLRCDGKGLEEKFGIRLTTLREYFEKNKGELLKALGHEGEV